MQTEKENENTLKNAPKSGKNGNWCGDMPQRTKFLPQNISLDEVVSMLSKAQKEKLISGYDIKSFARIFEDADLMATADGFLRYGMNVSEVSRKLYMHRNTLIYRLNKIQNVTGLDIRIFEQALTFGILRILYALK